MSVNQPDRTRIRRLVPARALVALLALVVTLGGFPIGTPATAGPGGTDIVRVWNAHTLAALTNPATVSTPGAGQPATVSALHMAMVQLAVYDAVNSITGGHVPYLSGLPEASASASVDAAVATATYSVLTGLGRPPVPALPAPVHTWLGARYAETLAAIPDGPSKSEGIAAGSAAATAMLTSRDGDGRYVARSFTVGTNPGDWRPTGQWQRPERLGDERPTVHPGELIAVPDRWPRELDSGAYASEYNEVRSLGSKSGSSRTPEQQALADFYIPNPVEMFQPRLPRPRRERGPECGRRGPVLRHGQRRRGRHVHPLLGRKEQWSLWRPVTAIHEGDSDGNNKTVGDQNWEPFLATPPYPDHVPATTALLAP